MMREAIMAAVVFALLLCLIALAWHLNQRPEHIDREPLKHEPWNFPP